ncbi:unnamed protein product [Pseudo-nitzschia multistriata]|uniref:Nuclear condensin complex subunit 3 C-terminal domain-containing protein n=1 Tax=Pseudo-nitzschia multistriata TaxID=183589 RepID=A0A448ZGN3_9STRA|nr:unnamed protein product [Pseudo-nitzschia multistriata]
MSIEDEISDYVQQQFEAFQLEEEDLGSEIESSSRAASTIEKHVCVLILNNGIEKLELNEEQNSAAPPSFIASTFLIPLLVKYTDAALAMETNSSNKDAVERVFYLVSALACRISSRNDEAVRFILERAETFSTVLLERLRAQACSMLGCFASHIGTTISRYQKKNKSNQEVNFLREDLESIGNLLLPRLIDKSQAVRQSAIHAAGMWFGSLNGKEFEGISTTSVLEGLLWSMWHDSSVTNRVEAVKAVPIDSAETLDHIIARIHDVKEKVRVAAIETLHLKVDPRRREIMTEEHFRDIIRHGLTERCGSTNLATTKLICTKWTKAAHFCPVELMRFMGATTYEEECEKALQVVLNMARSRGTTKSDTILQELSDPEIRSLCSNLEKSMVKLNDSSVIFDEYQLFYTRVACSTAQESSDLTFAQKEDLMSKTTPDIPTLCDLFQKHLHRFVESVQEDDEECMDQECFVCLQLLQLTKVTGLQEEGSRRHFANIMIEVLANSETPDDLIEDCVEALRAANENEFDFYNAVSLILANLTSTTSSVDAEATDHTRVLFIFSIVLENAPSNLSTHEVFDVMTKIILSAVTNSNRTVREIGICCFGKLGLYSDTATIASDFKPILLNIAANENESIQCRAQALLGLSDWAILFSDVLQPLTDSSSGNSLSLLVIVQEMIQHKNSTLSAIASEVATKLLFSAQTLDNHLLSLLLVSYLDPSKIQQLGEANDHDVDVKDVGSPLRLQQLLSLFFPAFCLKSVECRCQLLECIENALNVALNNSSKKRTKKRSVAFPLVKIVNYAFSIVLDSDNASTTPVSTEISNEIIEEPKANNFDPALMASLQVSSFLVKNGHELNLTQLRSLCKFLGNQDIRIENHNKAELGKLKDRIEELAFLDDPSSLKALLPLTDLLSGVESYEDHDDEGDEIDYETDQQDFVGTCDDDETISEYTRDVEPVDEKMQDEIMMDSIARLSLENKENPPSHVKVSRKSRSRRSSIQSNISVLESVGSPNV